MSNKLAPIFLIFFAILAWFTYKTIDGVLAIVLLDILLGLMLILSIIPIIGWIISLIIGWYYIIPWILGFAGIQYTWVIALLFWIFGISGFIITIIFLVMILGAMSK